MPTKDITLVNNCAIYCRTSVETEIEYSSIDSQKERLEAYAKSQGWRIHNSYVDDGYSGGDTNRPQFQQMLMDARLKKFQHIIVYKLDRFSRSIKDFHTLTDDLEKSGVSVVSVSQHIDTSNPMGRLLRNVLLDFAQFEREMTAERTKDKMYDRAVKGMWNGGTPPLGYNCIDADSDEAQIIKLIFSIFNETNSLAITAQQLNDLEYRNRKGNIFYKTLIANIISNSVYIGKRPYGGKEYDGQHQAIIDEKVFHLAQSKCRVKVRANTVTDRLMPLLGLIKCSCGGFMTTHYTQKTRKGGNKYNIYAYRCTKNTHKKKDVCNIQSLNADKLENAVFSFLVELAQDDEYINRIVVQSNEDQSKCHKPLIDKKRRMEKKKGKITEQINNLITALSEGKTIVPLIEEKIRSLESEKKNLITQITEINQSFETVSIEKMDADIIRNCLRIINKSPEKLILSEKKELAQLLIKEMAVHQRWGNS